MPSWQLAMATRASRSAASPPREGRRRDSRRSRRHTRRTVWPAWCSRRRPGPPSCPAAGRRLRAGLPCRRPARLGQAPQRAQRDQRSPPSFAMRSSSHAEATAVARSLAMVASDMSGELSGRVAIVTGGASGIGAASAALLAEAGATVIVADVKRSQRTSRRPLRAARRHLRGRLEGAAGRRAGARGPARHHGQQRRHLRRRRATSRRTTVENWQQVQAINSEGVFLGCKYAIAGHEADRAGQARVQGLDRQHLVDRGPDRLAPARPPIPRARARCGC